MLHPVIYVVTPKPSLLTRLVGTEGVLADRLSFSADRPDRTDWTADEYDAQAKLAFLMHMKSTYPDAPDVRLLLEGTLDESRFDTHWTLERIDLDDTLSSMTAALPNSVTGQTTSSAPHVREWLIRLRSHGPAR